MRSQMDSSGKVGLYYNESDKNDDEAVLFATQCYEHP